MYKNQRYAIDEFAAIVHPQNGHRKIFAMIQAYLDESGIHEGATICVIAGYFGGRSQMRKFERAWKDVLEDFDFPMEDFHAKDLIKATKHQPMLKALTQVIADQKKVRPISVAIVVDDFNTLTLDQRRWFTGAYLNTRQMKLTTSGCPSKSYFVPFQECLKIVTEYAPVGGKAHFFFGLDQRFSRYANAMFALIKKHARREEQLRSHWTWKDRLGMPAFPLASETAQLQAADLYVHLTYLHLSEFVTNGFQRIKANPLLTDCIRNRRASSDIVFQDRECLLHSLDLAREHYGEWKGFNY